ncbi:EAL domain-containing protein [Nitrogeniibacter mangrovi]|uniref:EAL domain-containing protein n=1 Tax=Nitrogeniibacter mangrovi TaxID=2016596 RepID=A0A6C1B122_9RHOO|nr:bifunctional diguanylate cyclase/phosphodiesterase [Nitrogeniibacter mangrovi]QID17316.1 EAL domain-containing protein [Nitrogeniibacter mangrovi]
MFERFRSRRARRGVHERWKRTDTRRVLDVLFRNLDGMAFRCAIDADWTMRFVSDGCEALTGYPAEDFERARVRFETITHPDDRRQVRDTIMAAVEYGRNYRVEYRIHAADGREKWVLERGLAVTDEAGELVLEGIVEDITDRVMAQLQQAETELRYRSIFENSAIGMFQTTADGRYIAANRALAALYGYDSPLDLIERIADISTGLYVDAGRREVFRTLIRNEGVVHDFESEVRRADGERIWISENAHAVLGPDGEVLHYEGTVIDITARRRYEHELEFRATHDVLTGLPNRNLLKDRLAQAIHHAQRSGHRVPVAFVDLDNFKLVNDSLGHPAGDELLRTIAARLTETLRCDDTVARYGGDEFVLVLGEQDDVQATLSTLERIRAAIAQPLRIGAHRLHVGCSIGVALYPDDGDSVDLLLSHADAAMYQAKTQGKGCARFYSRAFDGVSSERLALESALHSALSLGQIDLYYQPRVGLDGRPRGCEALMRWQRPDGFVPPDRFIPIAEETGLIGSLTDFALMRACADAAAWPETMRALSVSVNISSRMFADGTLPERVRHACASTGLPPQRLELEITESLLAEPDQGVGEQLHEIRAMGVRIALDDFGTGYCALAYLRQFPIDTLKVDRAFVLECDQSDDARALVRAIVSLGHSLGLGLVAEGLERASQLGELAQLGCDEFQGYMFAAPMPLARFIHWFASEPAELRDVA